MPLHDAMEPAPHAHGPLGPRGFSLLRASVGQRLMVVAVLLTGLWFAVWWALQ